MIKVDLDEAEGRLGDLIEEAGAGQEVIITSAGGATMRLVVMAGTPAEGKLPVSAEPANTVPVYAAEAQNVGPTDL